MKSKKTFIKYIIVLAIVILALCIGKTTSFADKRELNLNREDEPIKEKMDLEPSQLDSFSFKRGPGIGDPSDVLGNTGDYPFLCVDERTGWRFYSQNEDKVEINSDSLLYYSRDETTKRLNQIETSIAFGLMTATKINEYDKAVLQPLVWGSCRYAGQNGYISTVRQGNGTLYETSGYTTIKRARQYGDFYYGVLNGSNKAISLNLDDSNAKIYIDQENKELIVGPYQLTIDNLPNNKFTDDGKTFLHDELTGVNKQKYPNAPIFASKEIKDITQNNCNIIVVDKNGTQCTGNFPNWDEDFYFKYTNVSSNISDVNPQISISHINSVSGKAYYYNSNETNAQIKVDLNLDEKDWVSSNEINEQQHDTTGKLTDKMKNILNYIGDKVTLGTFNGGTDTLNKIYNKDSNKDSALLFVIEEEHLSSGASYWCGVEEDKNIYGILNNKDLRDEIDAAEKKYKDELSKWSSALYPDDRDKDRGYRIYTYYDEKGNEIGAIYDENYKEYNKILEDYHNGKIKDPEYSTSYVDDNNQWHSHLIHYYSKLDLKLRLIKDGQMQGMIIFEREDLKSSDKKWKYTWGNGSVGDTKHFTIVIGGNTWEDEPATKVGGQTGKKGNKNYAGMLVQLYQVPYGSSNSGGTLIRTTTTDENGNYRFINLNPFMKYYVVFTYNGQLYQATTYNDNLSGGYSNANEINRAAFNSKFSTINSTPNNYNGNKRVFPYKATISKTSNTTFEDLWEGDEGTGGFRNAVVNLTTLTQCNFNQQSYARDYSAGYNYLETNGNSDVKSYVQDCMISAKTRTYPVYNQFAIEDLNNPPSKSNIRNSYKGWDYLYTKESDQARYVDFGIYRRETSEVRLQKDLYQAKVMINGKEHTYEYNRRDPSNLSDGSWVLNTRASDVAYHAAYTRPLRKSEYLYDSSVYDNANYRDVNKNLQVYVTYRITVGNYGMIPITINEIVDYYDQTQFTFVKATVNPDDGSSTIGSSDTSTTGNTKNLGHNYKAKYLTQKINLNSGDLGTLFITFKVKNDSDTNRVMLDLNTVGKRNIAEIDGYSSVKGIVDTFSNPGNLEASDIDQNGDIKKDKRIYEQDCDKAPNLKLTIVGDREIKGTVFEDNRTINSNNAIIGDGKQSNETKIKGVKVELVELVSDLNGGYLGEYVWDTVTYNSWNSPTLNKDRYSSGSGKAKIILNGSSSLPKSNGTLVVDNETLGAGEYGFKSVPPGDFYVRFTYGDHVDTVLVNSSNEVTDLVGKGQNAKSYNGQDFKSTVYQKDINQNSNYNGINGYNSNNYAQNNPTYNNKNSLYYYDIAKGDAQVSSSDAKDVYSYREKVNNWSKGANRNTLLNNRAETLASFEKLGTVAKSLKDNGENANAKSQQNSMIQDFINNTQMVAKTGVIDTEIEYNGNNRTNKNDQEYNNNGNAKDYVIKNIDLGLVERPRAQLKLTKELSNIKISLANGNIIFNSNQAVNNLVYMKHNQHKVTYDGRDKKLLDRVTPSTNSETHAELIQAYMDEELIAGANIEATYRITVENVGEVDYTETEFYYTGTGGRTISKTGANKVIDYVSNLIEYDSKNNGNTWTVQNAGQLISSSTLSNNGSLNVTGDIDKDFVNRHYLDRVSTYNRVITTDKLNGDLIPELLTGNQATNDSSRTTSLVLTKTLSNTSGDEEFIYNNLAEIIETHNDQGRRMQFSIAGNQEMADQSIKTNNANEDAKTAIKVIQASEIDADSAQKIVILPPTGANKNIIIISIAVISALAIVACGIVAIRKILGKK